MTLIQSTRSRPRSHVLHGPAENPQIQHLAPNRTVTESHLLGVCSVTDAEQNGVLLGLSPAATSGAAVARGWPPPKGAAVAWTRATVARPPRGASVDQSGVSKWVSVGFCWPLYQSSNGIHRKWVVPEFNGTVSWGTTPVPTLSPPWCRSRARAARTGRLRRAAGAGGPTRWHQTTSMATVLRASPGRARLYVLREGGRPRWGPTSAPPPAKRQPAPPPRAAAHPSPGGGDGGTSHSVSGAKPPRAATAAHSPAPRRRCCGGGSSRRARPAALPTAGAATHPPNKPRHTAPTGQKLQQRGGEGPARYEERRLPATAADTRRTRRYPPRTPQHRTAGGVKRHAVRGRHPATARPRRRRRQCARRRSHRPDSARGNGWRDGGEHNAGGVPPVAAARPRPRAAATADGAAHAAAAAMVAARSRRRWPRRQRNGRGGGGAGASVTRRDGRLGRGRGGGELRAHGADAAVGGGAVGLACAAVRAVGGGRGSRLRGRSVDDATARRAGPPTPGAAGAARPRGRRSVPPRPSARGWRRRGAAGAVCRGAPGGSTAGARRRRAAEGAPTRAAWGGRRWGKPTAAAAAHRVPPTPMRVARSGWPPTLPCGSVVPVGPH